MLCLELRSENRALQETLSQRETVIQSLVTQVSSNEMTELSLRQSQIQSQTLLTEVSQLQDYLAKTEDKLYNTNVTALDLLKQLKASEEECESLKAYIIDMKQRTAIYVPQREDETDVVLAEFLNSYPDRSQLKVSFVREA